MEILVSAVLALATLAFVLAPLLWPTPSAPQMRPGTREKWLSLPQLELDRALGKIDEAEFHELEKRTASEALPGHFSPAAPADLADVEAAVAAFRRARAADRSLETEILIQRARHKRADDASSPSPLNLTS